MIRDCIRSRVAGLCVAAVIGATATCSTSNAEQSVSLLPDQITLSSPEARQTLVVQSRDGGGQFGKQVADAVLKSSDEKVVRIEDGVAVPVANGKATVTATAGDQTATAEVTVTGQSEPFTWSFRNHVES